MNAEQGSVTNITRNCLSLTQQVAVLDDLRRNQPKYLGCSIAAVTAILNTHFSFNIVESNVTHICKAGGVELNPAEPMKLGDVVDDLERRVAYLERELGVQEKLPGFDT